MNASTPMSERAKLSFTPEQARKLLHGGIPAYKVIRREIVDTSRWSIHYEIVIQRLEDGRFFADTYSVGATECQEESPWDYTEPDFREVYPQERVIIDYK